MVRWIFCLVVLATLTTCGRLRTSSSPSAPQFLTSYPHWQGNNLVWQPASGSVATLIVRSTSPITWSPSNGHTYSVGTPVGVALQTAPTVEVIYFGGGSQLVDNGLTNDSTYYYALYAFDGRRYSPPVTFTAPAGPSTVGYGGGYAYDAAYQGGYAYTLSSHYGVIVYGGIDEGRMDLVGTGAFTHFLTCIAVHGNYAYIGTDDGQMVVADISDPAHPKELTEIVLNDIANKDALAIAYSGTHVYEADRQGNVYSIDVSDPANPVLDDTYATGTFAIEMALAGSYLVVSTATGVQTVDITDPKNLVQRGTLSVAGVFVRFQTVSPTMVALGSFSTNIKLIDISNPASPTLAGTYTTVGQFPYVYPIGTKLLVNDSNGLKTVDISNPASPALLNTVSHPTRESWTQIVGTSTHVAIVGADAVRNYDITNPASPVLKATHYRAAAVSQAAVSGNYVYTGGTSGFTVIDASPLHLNLQVGLGAAYSVNGKYLTYLDAVGGSNANSCGVIRISGHYLHCAGTTGDPYVIFDVSDPTAPVLVGQTAPISSYVNGMAIQGNYAYLALAGSSGLQIYDFSDPTNPTLRSTYNTGITGGYGVTVSGNYAYFADNGVATTNGLHIIDVSNPSSPTLAGELTKNTDPDINDIFDGPAIAGHYAFVPSATPLTFIGLIVVDISNPAAPTRVASQQVVGGLNSVAYRDGYLFALGGGVALNFFTYDVTNPLSPTLLASPRVGDSGFSIFVDQGHAWLPAIDHIEVFAGLPGY